MNRLSNLNAQFPSSSSGAFPPRVEKPQPDFTDCWSYLDCDEFLTPEGINMKERVADYMKNISYSVSVQLK